ncbi:MAG: hypothetical protein AB7U79_03520 [Candidatus Izemoplasmatales bacterium]
MFTTTFILQVILTALILYFAFNSYFHYQVFIKLPMFVGIILFIFYVILQLDRTYTLIDYLGLGLIGIISLALYLYERFSNTQHLFFFCIDKLSHQREKDIINNFVKEEEFIEGVKIASIWKLGIVISSISYVSINKMTTHLEKQLQKSPKKLAWNHLFVYVLTVLFVIVLWRF